MFGFWGVSVWRVFDTLELRSGTPRRVSFCYTVDVSNAVLRFVVDTVGFVQERRWMICFDTLGVTGVREHHVYDTLGFRNVTVRQFWLLGFQKCHVTNVFLTLRVSEIQLHYACLMNWVAEMSLYDVLLTLWASEVSFYDALWHFGIQTCHSTGILQCVVDTSGCRRVILQCVVDTLGFKSVTSWRVFDTRDFRRVILRRGFDTLGFSNWCLRRVFDTVCLTSVILRRSLTDWIPEGSFRDMFLFTFIK